VALHFHVGELRIRSSCSVGAFPSDVTLVSAPFLRGLQLIIVLAFTRMMQQLIKMTSVLKDQHD
jgi:hypothetical protein